MPKSPAQRAAQKRPRALALSTAVETPAAPLTPLEAQFCRAYLAEGFNGTRAYQASHPNAGPGTASTEAYRLLSRPQIQGEVARCVAELAQKHGYTADDHFRGLVAIATLDIGDLFDGQGRLRAVQAMPKHVRLAIDSVKIKAKTWRRKGKSGTTTTITEVRLAKRMEAFELLGRFHNLQSLPEAQGYQPAFILTDTKGPSAH